MSALARGQTAPRKRLLRQAVDIAIIGAGPYGLATAAHLRARSSAEVRIFGEPMSFWEAMPKGMLLRSAREACHIGFASGELTLDRYEELTGRPPSAPVPLSEFVAYGRWFQRTAVPEVDRRRVVGLTREAGGFKLALDGGECLDAARVVVAAGIEAFAHRPPAFCGLPPDLVSHASAHRDLSALTGARVVVIGGGQSALESAALLHEANVEVSVIARAPALTWLRGGVVQRRLGRLKPLLYAQTDVGPAGISRIVATPALLRSLPGNVQAAMARRAIRPAGARWLVERLRDVPIETGLEVTEASRTAEGVRLTLDDGSRRYAERLILATGYRVDVSAYPFLGPELRGAIQRVGGLPVLDCAFQSSIPGLHFIGAPAARSFGPTMRFVSGSWYAADRLTAGLRRLGGA